MMKIWAKSAKCDKTSQRFSDQAKLALKKVWFSELEMQQMNIYIYIYIYMYIYICVCVYEYYKRVETVNIEKQ